LPDFHSLRTKRAEIGDIENSIHHGDAEQRNKADRGGDAEIKSGEIERNHSATDREWNSGDRQKTVAQRVEQTIQQNQDQKQGDRNNDHQPLLGGLEVVKL